MKKKLINILLFVLMSSAVLDKAEAQNAILMEKPARYKLHVKNDSQQSGSICVYQTFPEQENQENFYSLAWFSKAAHPGTLLIFEWDLNYSFVWRESGGLTPEMKFYASESKKADPSNVNNNYALFSRKGAAYFFKETTTLGKKDLLTIKIDDTVPNNRASVGIGVGGKLAIAVNAYANMSYQFTPKPTYWIVFGNFEEGKGFDVSRMSQAMEIVFDYNVYDQSLRFAEDNTWEVLN